MDEFLDRLWKSLVFVCLSFLLIYFLIATSGERPTGLNLVIYSTMNLIFYWLLRMLALGLIGFVLFSGFMIYSQAQTEKEQKLQQEERRREEELRVKAHEADARERKRLSDEKKAREKRQAKREQQNQINQKEHEIKNRSAKEANDAALKNFL